MKKTILLFFIIMLAGCSSDETNPVDLLPPATQTGANTFGCLIDGKAYLPRCEKPSVVFPIWGMIMWGGLPSAEDYNEIEVKDLKSEYYFKMLIHIDKLYLNRVGQYTIYASNGENSIDGLDQTNVYCIIFDKNSNQYKKYISYDNSGVVSITNYTLGTQNPLTGTITSGTFSGYLKNIEDPSDEIEIKQGRFDINSLTVIYKEFP